MEPSRERTAWFRQFALLSLLLVAAAGVTPGCVSHQHRIGVGGTGSRAESARQFYVLFGLIRLNEVNVQRMSDDLTSYDIDSRYGWVDLALSPLLLPLTVTSRTVTVTR